MEQQDDMSLWCRAAFDEARECGGTYELTPDEELVRDIFYWARNRGWGKDQAIKLRVSQGPYGFKGKNGWWWPRPEEGCDHMDMPGHSTSEYSIKAKKYKVKVDPWAIWKHCKTKEHITYLIRHRLSVISISQLWINHMPKLIKVVRDGIPLHVNDEDPVTQFFVKDALSGHHWDVNKYCV